MVSSVKNLSPRECDMYLFIRTNYPRDFSLQPIKKEIKMLCLHGTNNDDIYYFDASLTKNRNKVKKSCFIIITALKKVAIATASANKLP